MSEINAEQLEQIRGLVVEPGLRLLDQKLDSHTERVQAAIADALEKISGEQQTIGDRVGRMESRQKEIDGRVENLESLKWKALLGWSFTLAVFSLAATWLKASCRSLWEKLTGAQ